MSSTTSTPSKRQKLSNENAHKQTKQARGLAAVSNSLVDQQQSPKRNGPQQTQQQSEENSPPSSQASQQASSQQAPSSQQHQPSPQRTLANSQGDDSQQASQNTTTLKIPVASAEKGVWKFFNPGNRNFLEVLQGKIQIIGSRRIQMFIESVPSNAKFLNAQLYIQKGDTYDLIQNCVRCQENGIPKVFCVLPRRGREHDYPWVTFRITCTSSAKHWKGASFVIGAEFLKDPSSSTNSIARFFSPPINVQSKLKTKDRDAMRIFHSSQSNSQDDDDDDFSSSQQLHQSNGLESMPSSQSSLPQKEEEMTVKPNGVGFHTATPNSYVDINPNNESK